MRCHFYRLLSFSVSVVLAFHVGSLSHLHVFAQEAPQSDVLKNAKDFFEWVFIEINNVDKSSFLILTDKNNKELALPQEGSFTNGGIVTTDTPEKYTIINREEFKNSGYKFSIYRFRNKPIEFKITFFDISKLVGTELTFRVKRLKNIWNQVDLSPLFSEESIRVNGLTLAPMNAIKQPFENIELLRENMQIPINIFTLEVENRIKQYLGQKEKLLIKPTELIKKNVQKMNENKRKTDQIEQKKAEQDQKINVSISRNDSHWAKENIEEVIRRGIVNDDPDKKFHPDQLITRAEFLAMAEHFNQMYFGEAFLEPPFTDVSPNDWFYPYIKYGNYIGHITDNPDHLFLPNDFISRAESLKILFSNYNRIISPALLADTTSPYPDVPPDAWFAPYVRALEQDNNTKLYEFPKKQSLKINRKLWLGITGSEVEKLQTKLLSLGHYRGTITGIYDTATQEAVYQFQVQEGIVKTPFNGRTNGSVGDKTLRVLNNKQENPNSSLFRPHEKLTRAEAATLIATMIKNCPAYPAYFPCE